MYLRDYVARDLDLTGVILSLMYLEVAYKSCAVLELYILASYFTAKCLVLQFKTYDLLFEDSSPFD